MRGVALVKDKMRENILRWFGHLYLRSTDVVVWMSGFGHEVVGFKF